jgi:hypothetical protein
MSVEQVSFGLISKILLTENGVTILLEHKKFDDLSIKSNSSYYYVKIKILISGCNKFNINLDIYKS